MMDIFISYRRAGGSFQANLLNTKLSAKGIKVFLDKHKMTNGDFEKTIKRNIDSSPNFLLVLSPGIFDRKVEEGEKDWVREEIIYATQQNKNFIVVMFEGFDPDSISEDECKEISRLRTYDFVPYNDSNAKLEEASINSIIERMVDKEGKMFSLKKQTFSNVWYSNHDMTDEDKLWIISDRDVCKRLDYDVMLHAIEHTELRNRDEIALFSLKVYDVDTYYEKYSMNIKGKAPLDMKIQVYGLAYESELEYANEVFGYNHFLVDPGENDYGKAMDELLRKNGLSGFDMVDLTLIVKDTKKPEKVIREIVKRLNPDTGVIYIRELDDDFIMAYPDEKLMIKKLVELLRLDEGAGNRHLGMKVFNYLKKSGADFVYMSDQIVSTANHKAPYRRRIFDTYFSYLLPELRALSEENIENEEYKKAYHWLEENYDELESMFSSTEFYFRAGYIAGYGVYSSQEE